MSLRSVALGVAAVLSLSIPTLSHAFTFSGIGAKLGYAKPENLDGTMALGGHLNFDHVGTGLRMQPNVLYWKSDGISDVQPSLDFSYRFAGSGQTVPYLGAGLGISMYNADEVDFSDTNLGINLLGGMSFANSSRTDFFIEGRYTASDVSQFALLGGLTFGVR